MLRVLSLSLSLQVESKGRRAGRLAAGFGAGRPSLPPCRSRPPSGGVRLLYGEGRCEEAARPAAGCADSRVAGPCACRKRTVRAPVALAAAVIESQVRSAARPATQDCRCPSGGFRSVKQMRLDPCAITARKSEFRGMNCFCYTIGTN